MVRLLAGVLLRELPPGVLPGPVRGQVDRDAVGVASDPTGHVDQVPANGGRAGGGVAASGQGRGGGAGECAIAVRVSQALFGSKAPEGRCVRDAAHDQPRGDRVAGCRRTRCSGSARSGRGR
jgi:hypothetical protein